MNIRLIEALNRLAFSRGLPTASDILYKNLPWWSKS